MPHPRKDVHAGTTSPEFLALLSQLHELHDRELHSLRVEVARLRKAVTPDSAGSKTPNPVHTEVWTNMSTGDSAKLQTLIDDRHPTKDTVTDQPTHLVTTSVVESTAKLADAFTKDEKHRVQIPPELGICLDEKATGDGPFPFLSDIPLCAVADAPIARQPSTGQYSPARTVRSTTVARVWHGLSSDALLDNKRPQPFVKAVHEQASRCRDVLPHECGLAIPGRNLTSSLAGDKVEEASHSCDAASGECEKRESVSSLTAFPQMLARMSARGEKLEHLPFATKHHENVLEDVSWKECAEMLVNHPVFEASFAFMIGLNAVTMALDSQHTGFRVGQDIGYDKPGSLSFTNWSWAPNFFEGTEMLFGIVFTMELLMKVVGTHVRFHKDAWNWIDAAIVVIWLAGALAQVAFPIDASMLRIIRLVRLLRLLRLVRMIHSFDALYLMTTALKGCVSVLGWACALLFLVQMFIALLLNQYLYDSYFSDMSRAEEDLHMMFEYFGTFSRTMMSMFEITLGNWPPVCRLLSENVSEMFMLLCIIHKLIIGFAVVGVINGVFMQETFKVASIDDRIMLRQKERAIAVHRQKMHQLFAQADTSRDGYLSLEEFREVVGLPQVKTWLGSMELDAGDVDNLYSLIDDNDDGFLSARELIEGVARLKGSARSIDIVVFMKDFRRAMTHLNRRVSALHDALERTLASS